MSYISLQSRSVIALYGPDMKDFLQSIITNDINKLDSQKSIYSLLLSPQGKYLYDFFLIRHGKYIFLECENTHLRQIVEKLHFLKTYLRVKIKDISSSYEVGVLFSTRLTECNESQIIFQDPRHKSLGIRIIHKGKIKQTDGDFTQYDKLRIQNLVPDGTRDMVQNLSFPLQYLVDKVNGISFNKGCYIGQEAINRMSKQETFRRKLYLVEGNNALPDIGTKITTKNNEEIGELRSSADNVGLALLYTGKNHSNLYAGDVKISVCSDASA